VCLRHDYEFDLLPSAVENGWPLRGQLDFEKFGQRLGSLRVAERVMEVLHSPSKSRFHRDLLAEAAEEGCRIIGQHMQTAGLEDQAPG
jgi:hypothetical protein